MTQREADRLGVVQALDGRTLRQTEAAIRLGLSVRQVKRLLRRWLTRRRCRRQWTGQRPGRPPGPTGSRLSTIPGGARTSALRQDHERQGDITALRKRGHFSFALTKVGYHLQKWVKLHTLRTGLRWLRNPAGICSIISYCNCILWQVA